MICYFEFEMDVTSITDSNLLESAVSDCLLIGMICVLSSSNPTLLQGHAVPSGVPQNTRSTNLMYNDAEARTEVEGSNFLAT